MLTATASSSWSRFGIAATGQMEAERAAALTSVAAVDAVDAAGQPHPDDVALPDALPYLRLNLAATPGLLLRRLFEVVHLTINLHEDSDDVTITITLPAGELRSPPQPTTYGLSLNETLLTSTNAAASRVEVLGRPESGNGATVTPLRRKR
jgi:hypothetical protein